VSSRALLRSFAGGEITPELYGRIDLSKYQTGLAKCLNFRVLPHGPAQRRPGFKFVNQCKDSTRPVRLIPFAFSADQTVVLEVGHLYIRFHPNGQTLLEPSKTVVGITAGVVTVTAHGWATGDWVFLGGRFFVITVTGANTFTATGLRGQAATAAGATAARVYTLATPYNADTINLLDIHYVQNSDVLTLVHPAYPAKELKRLGAANWTLTDISFAPSGTVPTGVSATATVAVATNLTTQRYKVTAVLADNVTETLASVESNCNNNLTLAGNFNTIAWSAYAGATRYNVYKQRGGSYGYIGRTPTLSLVDDNITADTLKSPPEDIYRLNTGAGDYPNAVTYHEQRRWFAGTTNKPQNVWATRNGTESNLTSSLPSQDDDGLEFRIASRQQNAIRHLVPLSDMLALTVGAEFRIFADNAPSIAPASLSIKPQGYSGASNVQPVVTSGSVLYVQSQGARLREAAYSWQQNTFASIDISIMAPHLFNGFTLTDLAYSRAPVQEVWAVRSDGTALCMTYVPEQQVYGWSQHTTAGAFESVCTVSEGSEDVLYAVVKRNIGGTNYRYLERLQTRIFTVQADGFYVDSGLTYSGAPATTITGLWHLEGNVVQVLVDGATHPDRTVTGGSIALEAAAAVVHIGLGYASDLQTLPLALEGAPAGGQGTLKNVNSVRARVTQSSLFSAGPSFDKLTEYPDRQVSDNYDMPPALRTAELRMAVSPSWNSDAALCVRVSQPVPLTVMAMVLDVATGG
jgi:hypothetical protein